VAIAFALFASLAENLIQAQNIIGSIFYGVVLALFLVAFFLRRVGGTAVFWAALAAQALVFVLYASLNISYLWYNVIGCAACVVLSLVLQWASGPTGGRAEAVPTPGPRRPSSASASNRAGSSRGAPWSRRSRRPGGSRPSSAARSSGFAMTATTTSARPAPRCGTARRASRSSSTSRSPTR